jgi:hypothetical protein
VLVDKKAYPWAKALLSLWVERPEAGLPRSNYFLTHQAST